MAALSTRIFGRRGFLLAQVLSLALVLLVIFYAAQTQQAFLAVLIGLQGLRSFSNITAYLRGELPAGSQAHPLLAALERAEAVAKDKNFPEAERIAREVLAKEPPPLVTSRAHFLLGWVALKQGDGRAALDHFSMVQGALTVPAHAIAAAYSLIGDEARALPRLVRELDELFECLRALVLRDAFHLFTRFRRHGLGRDADRLPVFAVRQRQCEATPHPGVVHRLDREQRAHVRTFGARVEMVHHGRRAAFDHFGDAELRADVDGLVGIFPPACANVLPPDFQGQASEGPLEQVGGRMRVCIDEPWHDDALRGIDHLVEIAGWPIARSGLDDPRAIDWNIYRRLGRVFLRLYEEQQDLPLYR
jgi:hypothetical protein